MKPGDRVMIYLKPLTEECPEEEGTLVSKRSVDGVYDDFYNGRLVETWLVRFDEEAKPYIRKILAPEA